MKTLGKDSQGMALLVVIFVVTMFLTMTGASLFFSQLDLKIASHHSTETQAFYHAEAGLNHGAQELANNDGVNDFAAVALPMTLFNNTQFGSGSYTVTLSLVPPGSPRIIEVASTGMAPNNSQKTVRAKFQMASFPPDMALTVNGDLTINGTVDLRGTAGGGHSNANVRITGNPGAQMVGGFTASGTMTISGVPCVGGADCFNNPRPPDLVLDTPEEKDLYASTHDEQPLKPLPTINPADFARRVAAAGGPGRPYYILNDNGRVTVGGSCDSSGLCSGGTEVATPTGWSWNGTMWRVSGNSVADGVYYAETPVHIGGSSGSESNPWKGTVIARDSIEYDANNISVPYPAEDPQLQNILIATGNDLRITGNVGLSGQGGAVLAHQQIGFSGNVTIYGYVYAGNGMPTWSGDPFPTATSGYNIFSSHSFSRGHVTIFYDLGQACNNPLTCPQGLQMVAGSWSDL